MFATSETQRRNPTYDKRVGRFRDSTGKFVSRTKILGLVDEEVARLEIRMQGHARSLVAKKIDLPQFELRMAEDLKLSHLRMMSLSSGGRINASRAQYGTVGRELRRQYEYLANFSNDLSKGKLTSSQIIKRASLYAASSRTAFHQAEKVARKREGFVEALRRLDAGAAHCPQCLRYDTQGQWLPVEQVTMPTVNCSCFHFCRCTVSFRRR